MKVEDVPQEQVESYGGGRKICYAVDARGKLVKTPSTGWSAEAAVTDLAWRLIEADLRKTREEVRAGRSSSLKYFMKRQQMDVALLAQNMGIARLRLRWHLRPRVFARLSDAWLRRYADRLDISVERLRSYRGENESGN